MVITRLSCLRHFSPYMAPKRGHPECWSSRPSRRRSDAMSSDDLRASKSGGQSSDGTVSELTSSDGAHTSMTSVMGTDEDEMVDAEGDSADELDDDVGDLHSLHPGGYHPSMHSSYLTENTYLANELFANSDVAASTRSLWAQDLDYREIHGRLYCQEWFMPIDDIEQMRLSLCHQVFMHVLGGEPTTVHLENPSHILDVGTGTGEWAIKMAEMFPSCEVVGIDIAAVAETERVPMNVFFEIEDAEDWDRSPDFYDLIHLRTMEGAFKDWGLLYDNIFDSLKPGGWIEMQDFDTTEGLNQFLEQFSEDSPIHQLFGDLTIAAEKAGRRRGNAHMDPRVFMDAGFVDVRATDHLIPISVAEKSAGKIWLIACLDSLEAVCLRQLTEYMGWDPEKCKAACEQAAREMANLAKNPEKSKGMVVKCRVVVGRKPFDAPNVRTSLVGSERSSSTRGATEDDSTPTTL